MRADFCQMKVAEVIKNHETYSFGELLTALRDAHSISRRIVQEEIGIKEHHLFYLEKNNLHHPLTHSEVMALADYFGVPFRILVDKMHDAIETKRKADSKVVPLNNSDGKKKKHA